MSYTLHFSDPTTSTTIVVPSRAEGTGINNTSTSLDLVGAGYTNYGLPNAQNFLKLLENFAGPVQPAHSITGQLWYDTSDTTKPVLRVNNGKNTLAKWPSANGVYQQTTDPHITTYASNIVDGDIWVDTTNNQLKISNAGTWTIVGPTLLTGTGKTGIEVTTASSTTGITFPIVKNWVNGSVVEIISYNAFTPRTVIDGFATIKIGTNLTNKVVAKYNGLAEKASALEISPGLLVNAADVFTKSDYSATVFPNLVTTGMVIGYGIDSHIPDGYLKCDHSAISISAYPDLYAKIGTTHGTGGYGTFRTPDMTTSTQVASGTYLTYIIKT